MDSLTQVALGGAVGYAVLGSKVGRKAILWGAALGTLPDLDVFLPYAGEVEAFTYHRGFSHSLLVHLLASPMIVWLILKVHTHTSAYKKGWFWLVFLSLTTHAVLDSFTVYGTQLLWPLTEYPVGISNLFIIDPLYTLPLLFGLAIAAMPKISQVKARRMNTLGIVISSLYIVWSLAAKVYIDNKVEAAFVQQNISTTSYISTPAPFTTLLWRIVAMSDNQYYEGYASVFDAPSEVTFTPFDTNPNLLKGIEDEWGVQRLRWFTKGFYAVERLDSTIFLADLRMGAHCGYVFNFAVGEYIDGFVVQGNYEKVTERPDLSTIGNIWYRIWDPSVPLSPVLVDGKCKTTLP
ncbi:MAG: inner membrane protein [Alphaproteobacteria bacterium]|jgi:inner membrane protein